MLKRANVEIDESNEGTTVHASSFERQMLFKYVTAWNELAIAYQDSNRHVEAIEAFLTAIQIYLKMNMRAHSTFAIGDLSISKLHMVLDDIKNQTQLFNVQQQQ